MKEFYAKSDPKETIQQHTDNLLKNYELLKSTYPNLEIDWDMLYLACLYHDLGKINTRFQQRLLNGKKSKTEIPHGILSLAFIDFVELENLGYDTSDIKILFHSVGYHHEREINFTDNDVEDEIELIEDEFEEFSYDKLKYVDLNDTIEDQFFVLNDRIYEKNGQDIFFKYIMIKGLLNRIDYAASAHIVVENKNDFLSNDLENLINSWRKDTPDAKWNELQKYMIDNQDKSTIVIAQTGMGKTEAGLLWIGDNKGFFTLPLKTAINSIYERVTTKIVTDDFQNKVGLLHSDTRSQYLNLNNENIDFDEYYDKTKQLSLPLTICTLDQIFDFVYRYRGFESKLATLAYSKVVIDEIQMYTPQLLSYLIIGIRYITKVGGKFSILTATLPSFIIDILKEEEIEFAMPDKPFIDSSYSRHRMMVVEDGINVDYILSLYNKNKVLVICNTVRKAQAIYKELEKSKVENINLLHSSFIRRDRKDKEDAILEIGKLESEEYGIWISTQIVEASLDIDFDVLITELSDLNGLFQRMGRCYRKRELIDDNYNCHVFIGSEKDKCSGIGPVIDREIFDLSRKHIKDKDGILTEKEKVDLVASVYTTENLKDTKYYTTLKENISYVRSIDDYEKTKKEIQEMFRGIDSRTVIPIDIYNLYKNQIKGYISILNTKYDNNMSKEERKKLKREKIISRDELMNFTVNIRNDQVEGNILEELELSKYEKIPVIDSSYSEEIGIVVEKKDKKEKLTQEYRFD
ncbi:CRISPR-associated helicase Cas3' [Tissierella sp. Yu-01]|uniref:CRISPR-associated helicase Cas3' n=1 Tax=Tissierella sp. Yu-01 TaxID=3035694 RepID=UPI00240CF776|nr:CRISPR-associated helicase Cas3' [Tissierella sp. Yu-01]WFA10093.1 CRISPR-associated helicase Cas3' [Tissierella sp. Yu-01]